MTTHGAERGAETPSQLYGRVCRELGVAPPVDPDAWARWMEDSCQASGVPFYVEDPDVLARVARTITAR